MALDELYQIFQSLGDTFIRYLNPNVFIDWFSRLHPEVAVQKLDDILANISDKESDILAFTQILSRVTKITEIKHHIDPKANTDPKFECFYLKYVPLLIKGELTKKLSLENLRDIAKALHKENLILKKNYDICISQNEESDIKREIFKSIKRGKPHWPFVFIEIIKQKRADIFKVFFQEEATDDNEEDQVLHADNNRPRSPSFISYTSNSTSLESDEISLDSDFYFEELDSISDGNLPLIMTPELKAASNLELLFVSGAISREETIEDPPEKVNTSLDYEEEIQFSDEDDEESVEATLLPLQLREYQKELAEKALQGLNTIICAPTGSGKTKVAMHIILQHLHSDNSNRRGKVVFFAKTVPLVIQQFNCIRAHLPEPYKAKYLIGRRDDSTHLHRILPNFDVIVMTPKILENHLNKKYISLDNFSLFIFDECHHTCRGETYNNIMLEYIKTKYSENHSHLPQIIGLTASIGIGKAENIDAAITNIMKICGNLDADAVCIVEKNLEELKKLVPIPTESAFRLIDHEQDPFVLQVISFFFDLEMKLNEFCKKAQSKWLEKHIEKLNSTLKRSSQHYCQWAVTIRNIARLLPRSNNQERELTRRSMIVIADFLIAYNNALEVHNLIHLKNAMEYLEKKLEKYLTNDKPTSIERECIKSFESLKRMVVTQHHEENPYLQNIKIALVGCMKEESRGIIFLRTRALAYSLSKWLNDQKELTKLKLNATVFTGCSAPPEKGGMSQETQKNIIEKFKNGKIRLLVATSVAEEGLDIPECNFVIKYNHIGNEVTLLQVKGRCRKVGGVSILLATNTNYDKEMINLEKVELMKLAITNIAGKNVATMNSENIQYQKQVLEEEKRKKETKKENHKAPAKIPFKMHCHLCGELEISSENIRTIKGSHRVVVDRNIWESVQIRGIATSRTYSGAQQVGSVHCNSVPENEAFCFNKLGSLMVYRGAVFFALGIENFSVDVKTSNQLAFYSKWKAVPYAIEEITEEDFKRFCPEKSVEASDDINLNEDNDSDTSREEESIK